jgi:hypothetical protein
VVTLAMPVPTLAQEYAAQPVKVTWVWTREMPKLAGSYMTIANPGSEPNTCRIAPSLVPAISRCTSVRRSARDENAQTQIRIDDQVG